MRSINSTISVKTTTSILFATTVGLIYFLYTKNHKAPETISTKNISKKKRTKSLPLGIVNVGNSCYLNSVLQLLAATGDILIEHFEIKTNNPIGRKLSEVLKRINSDDGEEGDGKALRPNEFIRSFSGSNGFSTDQQDAHEFLLAILNLPTARLSSRNPNSVSLSLSEKSEISQFYKEQNPFSGLILNELICLPCAAGKRKIRHISSINLEPFTCITLTLTPTITPNTDGINEIVYKHFCVPEKFSDYTNFTYLGVKCGKGAVKQKNPLILPELLFLHISLLDGGVGKTTESIKNELELSGPGYRYNLLGIIVHFGNDGKSGHFVCYRKHQNFWIECNDAVVRKVSEAEVLSQQAYILVYNKQI